MLSGFAHHLLFPSTANICLSERQLIGVLFIPYSFHLIASTGQASIASWQLHAQH